MKWKDLKKQGIRRCCCMFTDGRQCKRRVAADWPDAADGDSTSWCRKHQDRMRAVYQWANQVMLDERDGTNKAGKSPEGGAR